MNQKQVKILYVSANGYLGGAEKFVLTACEEHLKRSIFKPIILFFSYGEFVQMAQSAGIKNYVLKTSFKMRNLVKLFFALIEVRKIVKEINPDIIHSTMPYSHIILSLATLGMRMKKIWFQHGPVGGKLDLIANLFSVDQIFYNSLDLKQRHHLTFPKPKVKFGEWIIPLGVHFQKRQVAPFSQNQLTLGMAGRICSWKGFHHVILAIGQLKQETALRDFKLLIAGSAKTNPDKQYMQDLKDAVSKMKLESEIQFLDHLPNLNQFYTSLDILIHASTIPEPFGLVVAEAMASGCLVIGSDSGGVKDILHDQQTGLTFDSTSPEAVDHLKTKLKPILSQGNHLDKETYIKLAHSGQKFISENYTIPRMMQELENHYGKLLDEKLS